MLVLISAVFTRVNNIKLLMDFNVLAVQKKNFLCYPNNRYVEKALPYRCWTSLACSARCIFFSDPICIAIW